VSPDKKKSKARYEGGDKDDARDAAAYDEFRASMATYPNVSPTTKKKLFDALKACANEEAGKARIIKQLNIQSEKEKSYESRAAWWIKEQCVWRWIV